MGTSTSNTVDKRKVIPIRHLGEGTKKKQKAILISGSMSISPKCMLAVIKREESIFDITWIDPKIVGEDELLLKISIEYSKRVNIYVYSSKEVELICQKAAKKGLHFFIVSDGEIEEINPLS